MREQNSTARRVDQQRISDFKLSGSCEDLLPRHEQPQQAVKRAHSTQPVHYSWEEARSSTPPLQLAFPPATSMETVNTPSPGMFASVLRVLAAADSRESSESACMEQLARNLTSTEAHQLPYAIGEVLGLLRGAPASLQYASDLIVTFNLHEAASNLVDVALREADARDRRLLLNAASICGHPSVPEDARARIAEAVSEIPAARIRLDPEAPASNERMRRLQKRCWPGLLTGDEHFGLPPTVVFDSSINRLDVFTIGCALQAHGYAIRRIGEDNNLPEWFGNRTTVICATTSAHRFFSELDINEDQIVSIEAALSDDDTGLFDKNAVNKVLAKVWEARPSDWKPDASAPMLSHAAPHPRLGGE